jgi:hypothetical protein
MNDLGNILRIRAGLASGAGRKALLAQAIQRYDAAIITDARNRDALRNKARSLLELAGTDAQEDAATLIREARSVLLRVEQVSPGRGAYDLACLSSRNGRLADARHWLEKAKKYGELPDISDVVTDTDLVPLHSTQWFWDFVGRAPGG